MPTIPQRELRNRSAEVLRNAERGTLYVVTVDGRPVAQVGPVPRQPWVPRSAVQRLLRETPGDPTLLADLDRHADKLSARDDPWAVRRRRKRAR